MVIEAPKLTPVPEPVKATEETAKKVRTARIKFQVEVVVVPPKVVQTTPSVV